MKKLIPVLGFILSFLFPLTLWAENITEEEALKIAQDFMKAQNKSFNADLAPNVKSATASASKKGYYVFNGVDNGGFVIVANDDRVQDKVLGYGGSGHFDYDELPCNVKALMDYYTEVILALDEASAENTTIEESHTEETPIVAASVPALMKTKWNQGDPYNLYCPTVNSRRCVTGCVATAMAQIMYYHQWPAKGKGSVSYTSASNKLRLSRDFSQSTYEWSKMKTTYGTSDSDASRKAVATLMRDCGYAVEMDYDPNGSGAYSNMPYYAFPKYFDYNSETIRYTYGNLINYTAEWTNIIQSELNQKQPTLFCINGHAFVCDGYNSNGYFHFNFGWAGAWDDWYFLSYIGRDGSYSRGTLFMVHGIKPNGKVTPSVPVTKIDLDKTSATIKDNENIQLNATVSPSNATNKSVTWSSSNTKVATVTSSGRVYGVSEGTATITCTSAENSKISKTCKVTVKSSKIPVKSMTLSKTSLTIKDNVTAELTATINPTDATNKKVKWTISDPTVATLSSNGVKCVITPKAVASKATATITCTSDENSKISKTCKLAVDTSKVAVKAMSRSKTSLTIKDNVTAELTATINPTDASNKKVKWAISDPTVATISSNGVKCVITPKAVASKATATITCTSAENSKIYKTCKLTVNTSKIAVKSMTLSKTSLTIKDNETTQLTVTINPKDATDQSVTWTSSDKNIATVSKNGLIKPKAVGKVKITCTSNSNEKISKTCTVTIKSSKVAVTSVGLNKTSLSLNIGGTEKLVAKINPTNATVQTVRWESSNNNVATVDADGTVHARNAGTAEITCTSVDNPAKYKKCKVTVKSTRSGARGSEPIEEEPVSVTTEPEKTFDVYNLSGNKVRQNVKNLDGLPRGLYIVNGKKVFKRE